MKCNLIEYVKVVFCLIQVGSQREKKFLPSSWKQA